MKRWIWLVLASVLLCGCAPAQQPATEQTQPVSLVEFYDGSLESAPLTAYPLSQLQEYFPYSSAVENNWCGAVNGVEEYNYPDVVKDFPGGVLRQYAYEPGVVCKYSVYKVAEGGWFFIFWDTVRGTAEPGYEALTEMWSSTMLYVPGLKSRSDFDGLELGVSTGANVTAIDPAAEFILTIPNKVPSRHLLSDGSVLEITYQMPDDCGCNYTRHDLVVTQIIQYEPGELTCALSKINPDDLKTWSN